MEKKEILENAIRICRENIEMFEGREDRKELDEFFEGEYLRLDLQNKSLIDI
ncbi:MAG: hypothetical protein GY756_13465 [bacterium]|nr:hypothetical protein [bacterium]